MSEVEHFAVFEMQTTRMKSVCLYKDGINKDLDKFVGKETMTVAWDTARGLKAESRNTPEYGPEIECLYRLLGSWRA